MRFGKTAQTAISVMSVLAEHHGDAEIMLSSAAIAQARDLSQPLVAKLLTVLSTAKLVDGARGPGGGYWLARPPAEISLHDIVALFERPDKALMCPFGPNWCGNGEPCPMHDTLLRLGEEWDTYLTSTTLQVFAEHKPAAARGSRRRRQG